MRKPRWHIRVLMSGILMVLQLWGMLWGISYVASFYMPFKLVLYILTIGILLYLISDFRKSDYKQLWILLLILFPLWSGFLYLLFGGSKQSRFKTTQELAVIKQVFPNNELNEQTLYKQNVIAYKQAKYCSSVCGFPLTNSKATYLNSGEVYFETLVKYIKQAEHYVLLEYFIIEEGLFFNTILQELEEKIKRGVQVYLIYDEVGSITKVNKHFDRILRSKGLHVLAYNALTPYLRVNLNYRDHRKLAIIDGQFALVGGVNLADEYINVNSSLGHFVDSGMLLEGEVVDSFVWMFLSFYNTHAKENLDYKKYKASHLGVSQRGYVMAYQDSPMDRYETSEKLHLSLIQMAKRYVYIKTPYLICDNDMLVTLMMASKMGIDVRIMLPFIPDKWYVQMVGRSNYACLLEAGVKIFEYTPGFIHCKEMICDDELAIIGSSNMDYRSYYWHYECGVWLYQKEAVLEMKENYLRYQEKCIEITETFLDRESWYVRIISMLLKIVAPFM